MASDYKRLYVYRGPCWRTFVLNGKELQQTKEHVSQTRSIHEVVAPWRAITSLCSCFYELKLFLVLFHVGQLAQSHHFNDPSVKTLALKGEKMNPVLFFSNGTSTTCHQQYNPLGTQMNSYQQ